MPVNLLKEAMKNAFEEVVDQRIGEVLGSLRDNLNSPYQKEVENYNRIFSDIRGLLGEENFHLMSCLDGAHCDYNCIAYEAIYRQAFLDGMNCKDANVMLKEVVNSERYKAS